MFKFLASIFAPLSPDPILWAETHAKKTTPDEIIAAAIVESLAKDFKAWHFMGEFYQRYSSSKPKMTKLWREGDDPLEIVFLFRQTISSDGYSTVYKYKVIGCEINGVRLNNIAFGLIYDAYQNISVKVRAAEAAAAKALKEQQENETKWNIAENLLGMKRTELGALVPQENGQ